MSPSVFSLTRIEFNKLEIEVNHNFSRSEEECVFPQLDFNFQKVIFGMASDLSYPDTEMDDPRHFTVMLRVSVKQSSQTDEIVLPYSTVVEGVAYLRFNGVDEGLNRFKAVRGTAYMMLYGAFREAVANFTGRSCHGVWFLPSPNFNSKVDKDAPADFDAWEKRKKVPSKPRRARQLVQDVDTKPVKKSVAKVAAATKKLAKKTT